MAVALRATVLAVFVRAAVTFATASPSLPVAGRLAAVLPAALPPIAARPFAPLKAVIPLDAVPLADARPVPLPLADARPAGLPLDVDRPFPPAGVIIPAAFAAVRPVALPDVAGAPAAFLRVADALVAAAVLATGVVFREAAAVLVAGAVVPEAALGLVVGPGFFAALEFGTTVDAILPPEVLVMAELPPAVLLFAAFPVAVVLFARDDRGGAASGVSAPTEVNAALFAAVDRETAPDVREPAAADLAVFTGAADGAMLPALAAAADRPVAPAPAAAAFAVFLAGLTPVVCALSRAPASTAPTAVSILVVRAVAPVFIAPAAPPALAAPAVAPIFAAPAVPPALPAVAPLFATPVIPPALEPPAAEPILLAPALPSAFAAPAVPIALAAPPPALAAPALPLDPAVPATAPVFAAPAVLPAVTDVVVRIRVVESPRAASRSSACLAAERILVAADRAEPAAVLALSAAARAPRRGVPPDPDVPAAAGSSEM